MLNRSADVSPWSSRPETGLALQGIESLNSDALLDQLERTRVAKLAREYGLDRVMRWKPRKVSRGNYRPAATMN